MTLLLRRSIQLPIMEHCLHILCDVGLNPSHRRIAVKILAKIGSVHRGQPRLRLVYPFLPDNGSAIGGPDFQGPALAHAAPPTTPLASLAGTVLDAESVDRLVKALQANKALLPEKKPKNDEAAN